MARNILFVTTDQQRFDSLGCNGGEIARTPTIDALAASGVNYTRMYANNTLCQPTRSTMLTGLYPRTHGVYSNGIGLPYSSATAASMLAEAGYRTALLGKAHFDPGIDLEGVYPEHQMPAAGDTGPFRGFEHAEFSLHTPEGRPGQLMGHYGEWLGANHPEHVSSFAPVLMTEPGGESGAPETRINPIPRDWYHTDWVADRTISWLDTVGDDEPWFAWMSFPDPHHPWDPPSSERHRVNWRDLDLPPGYVGPDDAETVLGAKPAHWLAYAQGRWRNAEGAGWRFRPTALNPDMIREINAMAHIMVELIDDACARVIAELDRRGWSDDTDVIFTTDHGELQGDYGFVFKGPFPTDSLMRLPMIWKPAASAGVVSAEIAEPVSQVDLLPTFCAIAGIDPPTDAQGSVLPTARGSAHERAICTWDSHLTGYGMHYATIFRDSWLCTAYEASTQGTPTGIETFYAATGLGEGPRSSVVYEGTEGELYDVEADPHQFVNRWNDPDCRALRDDLVDDLVRHLPARRSPTLPVTAPT
jgi:arylsulfatase A-like enzyme